jgi:gliding motility-associated-like protein
VVKTKKTHDDAAPTVTLSINNTTIAENAGTATVTATLSAISGLTVTVDLGYTGTATDGGADYNTTGASITIPAGSLTGTVTITSVDDAIDENNETVIIDIITVTNGSENGTQQVTTTITDDDAAPTVTLSINNVTIVENTGAATVTATLSGISSFPVTVDLAYTGTATGPGTDYNTTGASITIPAGSLTGTVNITSVDDVIDEANETVITDITSVTNGTESGTQQVTTTITDDDNAPTVALSINNITIIENSGTAAVTATLSAVSGLPVTVNLGYTGTATGAGADYNVSGASITIPAGSLNGMVTITSLNDLIYEGNETVITDITSVTNGSESGTQQVTTTITDDDAAPTVTLSISNATIAEAAGTATVTATLSAISGLAVTVNLGYTGTATGAGIDYNVSGTSIVIPAGSLTGTVTISSVNDAIDENNETVITDITSVTNGTESGTQQVTTSITDDDASPTVTLGIDNATIAENAGTATITVTVSAVSGLPVTVDLGYSGTAVGGSTDYNTTGASITIPAGSLTGTVTITSVSDALDENDETVIADITAVTNGTESGSQQVTTTITDDDAEPIVSLSIDLATLAENADVATLTATLEAVSGKDVTVNLGFSGTATGGGADYTESANSIFIPAGSLTGTITLTVIQDIISEGDETIITDITSVTNGTENGTQQVTATITDDEGLPLVTLSIDNTTIIENSGIATITATLDAISSKDVTVNLGFSGIATGGGVDYNLSGPSITILAGFLTGTITVTALQDLLFENDETVIAEITGAVNAAENGTQQVTTTIADDDTAPLVALSIDNSSIAENSGIATITATLDALSGLPVTVDLSFSGTAIGGGTDYNTTTSITIPAGALAGTVTITPVVDLIDEFDETVIADITLITNGTENGTQQVTTTITDSDAEPSVTLSVNQPTIVENSGVAIVTATLNTVSAKDIIVYLGLSGTATGTGTDYSITADSIVITAGSLSGTSSITSVQDAIFEGDETIIADITSVTNGTEDGTQSITTTITDDEGLPQVTLSIDSALIQELGGVATITATLDAISASDVTINLGITGTAADGMDYNSSATSITILAGATTGTITISSIDDVIDENDETVIVDILSVVNASENGTQQVSTTIADNDNVPLVALTVDQPGIAENGGIATITATLDAVSAKDVTITLDLTGVASNGTDYTPSSITILIPGGSTAGTITLTAIDDATDEYDETIIADITSVINGTEDGTQQVTTAITDDDAEPMVTLSVDQNIIAEHLQVATITATLDAVSGKDITVKLGFTGTAIGNTDYTFSDSTITIPAGLLDGNILIIAQPDLIYEGTETIITDITTVTNASEDGTQQVLVTITDDNTPPLVTLSVDQNIIPENAGAAIITATLDAISSKDVTIYFGYTGTATGSNTDYTVAATSITIPAGSTTGTVIITALQDNILEGDETVIADIDSVANGTENGTQQITVTIVDDEVANQIPVAVDDVISTDEDSVTIINVLANDFGLGDGGIVINIPRNGQHGTAVVNGDNTITYTPLPNYFGQDTIQYQVCDANSDCDTAYIIISLNSVDDIPLANNDTLSVLEDNQVTVNILTNDSGFGDGGITVSLISGGNNGSAILNGDNTITYTPDPNYFGSDTIVYQVCDSDGDCDTAAVIINVTDDNHIPVVTITNKYITTPMDVPVTICMNVTDADNDSITTTTSVKFGNIVKNDTSYCFTYTPNTGYTGNDTLILTFCDSRNACVTDTVWITVIPVGTRPQAANDTIYLVTTIDKEVQGCITMVGSIDGLVTTIISDPEKGTATISNQLCVNYLPNTGITGRDQLIATVCNPQGLCDTVVVIIDVIGVIIPDGFSPNGDGLNDLFEIQGLDAYDKVSVQIFNRWGNKVYESEIYKNDWDGTSQNAFKLGNSKLPAGTYFYIIDFNNGQKPQLGSIYLSR